MQGITSLEVDYKGQRLSKPHQFLMEGSRVRHKRMVVEVEGFLPSNVGECDIVYSHMKI